MKHMKFLTPVTMFLAIVAQTSAQELPLLGQGNIPCQTWLDRRSDGTGGADTMTAWVLGYLTAVNQYVAEPGKDITTGQETEALIDRIDQFCEMNPPASLQQASAALVEALRQGASE